MSTNPTEPASKPASLGPLVPALPQESSRDTEEGILICVEYDWCYMPNGAIVPFIIYAYQSDDANTTTSVLHHSLRTHTSNSIITRCYGDGAAKAGVFSGTVESICWPATWSQTVRHEGGYAVRHLDYWRMNNGNCKGRLYFMKELSQHPLLQYAQLRTEMDPRLEENISEAFHGPVLRSEPLRDPRTPNIYPGRPPLEIPPAGLPVPAGIPDPSTPFVLPSTPSNPTTPAPFDDSYVPPQPFERWLGKLGKDHVDAETWYRLYPDIEAEMGLRVSPNDRRRQMEECCINTHRKNKNGGCARCAEKRGSSQHLESHHGVIDYPMRTGNRKDAERNRGHRAPGAPSLNDQLTICISDPVHDILHANFDHQVESTANPDGTTTYGRVQAIAFASIDSIPDAELSKFCKDMYKVLLTKQFNMPSTRLLRGAERPLPREDNSVGYELAKDWGFSW